MSEVIVYACGSQTQADQARAFLIKRGFPASGITGTGPVDQFIYDAVKYGAQGTNDILQNVWIVQGQK